MTPEHFVKDLGAHVAANRNQEALDFWRRHYSELVPAMSSEQIVWVADLMHMADMAADMDAPTSDTRSGEPVPQSPRRA
jgi:hypothetical protein